MRIPNGLIILLFAAAAASGLAEQPRWASLAQRVLVTRPNNRSASPEYRRLGLWDFDRQSRSFSLLAPLFDEQLSLGALDDRLVVFTFPGDYELEAETWRVLRRYRAINAASGGGWSIYGALVSESQARVRNARPGRYGHLSCPRADASGEGLELCGALAFPWYCYTCVLRLLLHRDLDPGGSDVADAGQVYTYTTAFGHQLETYDPNHGGLWIANRDLVRFFPLTGSGIGEPTVTVQPLPPPLDSPPLSVRILSYQASKKTFYGVLDRVEGSWEGAASGKFVALKEDLSLDELFFDQLPYSLENLVNIPTAVTSFSETPPERHEQLIPIVAYAPGRNDTFWRSDLWLYNGSSEAMAVTVQRTVKPDVTRTVVLPGHASWHTADALGWVGGGPSGDGTQHDALLISSPYRYGAQLVASARVYTPSNDAAESARGGSMGHAVPAVPTRSGYSTHLPDLLDYRPSVSPDSVSGFARPSFVVVDRRQSARFRHNVGIVNQDGREIELTLAWNYLEWLGTKDLPAGALQKVKVPPHSIRIQNLEELFPSAVMTGEMAKVVIAGPPAVVWSSMIDNTTGDTTFVPFTMVDMIGMKEFRAALPVVARLPGSKGTTWLTDLYKEFYYPTPWPPRQIYFHPAWPQTSCGGAAAGGELVTESTAWRLLAPDVLSIFSECKGDTNVRGALELHTSAWMSAYARTYTTRADGGTYGEILPLYPYSGWPVQHFAGIEIGAQFRVNLGLYNGNKAHAITHRLSLYKADGTLYAERELTLKPWESIQERIEKMLGVPYDSIPAGTYGLTVLPLDDKEKGVEGRSWAYVSLVDNVTGDPTNWW